MGEAVGVAVIEGEAPGEREDVLEDVPVGEPD